MLTEPVSITFPPGTSRWRRIVMLLGHYDVRVYLHDRAFVDIGAGSLLDAERIESYDPGFVGSMGSIGRFSQAAGRILFGGEHTNHLPVNYTFSAMPVHVEIGGRGFGRQPPHAIDIGSGVVISAGAIVLDGVRVADGAVVAAGAVLTKDAEAFGIYAGVPAIRVKGRMPDAMAEKVTQVRWWDFAAGYMAANMKDLQALASSEAAHVYASDRPRLVIRGVGEAAQIDGFVTAAGEAPLGEAPAAVQEYVAQAMSESEPHQWVADIWAR